MENTPIIAGLIETRAHIETSIAELERQIRVRRLEIAQLDATICMFAPSVIAAKREATKFKRSVHFLTGELARSPPRCIRRDWTLATESPGGLYEADRLDAGADAVVAW